MTTKTLPNGVATTYNYDGMSRLTRLKDAKGATVLYDKQYAYNGSSQISQITDVTQTKNFAYDNVDRLTGVTGSSTENYAFDSVGNRTSSSLSATYAYQPNNRLTNTATASFTYNVNGNMTSKTDTSGTTNFVWDYENRLKQATKPNGTVVNFKYDALGRRSERNVNGTTWTKFTYDGQDVMLDQNSDGTTVRYLNGLGIDNKLRIQNGTAISYLLSDHLGSTTAQTDATGNITNTASYDGFGNSTNNLSTRYQFTGREFDADLGLQYSRARFYDAKLGRFISEDPIGFQGGDVNLFGYVKNNSLKYKDPTGLTPSGNFWFLGDFFLGTGSDQRTYPLGSQELNEMRDSPGADALRKRFYAKGCKNTRFGYSTKQAAKDTLADPRYWGDTSFQVGGFVANATLQNNGTVTYQINNYAGANSFFYHILPNAADGGPLRTIYQDFHWNEPIERCKCNEEVFYDSMLKSADNYNRLVGISVHSAQ